MTLTPRIYTNTKQRGQQGQCLVYGLFDPFTGELRYIGKSSNGMYRPKQHLSKSFLSKKTHLYNWINKVIKNGGEPEIKILARCTKKNLADKEIELIAKAKSEGARLTNMTDGGEGAFGRKMSEEGRKRISLAHKGKKLPREHVEKLRKAQVGNTNKRGTKLSQESKDRISGGNRYRMKPVRCLELNMVFNSVSEAASKVGAVKSNLIKHLKRQDSYKTICGLTFEYVEVK